MEAPSPPPTMAMCFGFGCVNIAGCTRVSWNACSLSCMLYYSYSYVTGCDVDGCVSQMTIIHTLYVIYNMQ